MRNQDTRSSAGDLLPEACEVIEVRVAELRQLFNAIDPSPFHERDLDPQAERFILDWASDISRDARLALVVHLERPPGRPDEATVLRDSIHEFFTRRKKQATRRLRELFDRGRLSLLIAVVFLGVALGIGSPIAGYFSDDRLALLLREGILIVGWVAMWRPVEIFLYDWWPIRAEARLFARLAEMPVRIDYREAAPADAWRTDWPETGLLSHRQSTRS